MEKIYKKSFFREEKVGGFFSKVRQTSLNNKEVPNIFFFLLRMLDQTTIYPTTYYAAKIISSGLPTNRQLEIIKEIFSLCAM